MRAFIHHGKTKQNSKIFFDLILLFLFLLFVINPFVAFQMRSSCCWCHSIWSHISTRHVRTFGIYSVLRIWKFQPKEDWKKSTLTFWMTAFLLETIENNMHEIEWFQVDLYNFFCIPMQNQIAYLRFIEIYERKGNIWTQKYIRKNSFFLFNQTLFFSGSSSLPLFYGRFLFTRNAANDDTWSKVWKKMRISRSFFPPRCH